MTSLTIRSIWTIGKDLKTFDRTWDYLHECKRFETDDILPTDSKDDGTEKLRHRAFKTDALMGKGQSFWINLIYQEREGRKIQEQRGKKRRRQTFGGHEYSSRQRIQFDTERITQERKKLSYSSQRKLSLTPFELDFSEDEESEDDGDLFVAGKNIHGRTSDEKDDDEQEHSDEQVRIQANHRQEFERMPG